MGRLIIYISFCWNEMLKRQTRYVLNLSVGFSDFWKSIKHWGLQRISPIQPKCTYDILAMELESLILVCLDCDDVKLALEGTGWHINNEYWHACLSWGSFLSLNHYVLRRGYGLTVLLLGGWRVGEDFARAFEPASNHGCSTWHDRGFWRLLEWSIILVNII